MDGDRGVTYSHRNLSLEREGQDLRSLATERQSRTYGNGAASQEPVLSNGPVSRKVTPTSNGINSNGVAVVQ